MNKWTDEDVANLIASVDETLAKAEALAKASPMDPDPADDKSAAPDQTAAPASDEAPSGDEAPPAESPQADQMPEAQAAGDQQLSQEDPDAPLSDEELSQIYGSMPPEELERHYSIIRQQLQQSYDQDQQTAAASPAAEQPPARADQMQSDMGKSEYDAKIDTLNKKIGELEALNKNVVKAFEALAKPARKSITELQAVHKSELDNGAPTGPMSAEQVKEAARKIQAKDLTKHERDAINRFYIQGEGQAEIEKIIHSKGGK